MLRNHDRWPTLAVQLSAVCAALLVAWVLRFDFSFPYPRLVCAALPVLTVCRWISLSGYRLTHNYWRNTGIGDLLDLVKSIAVGSLLFVLAMRILTYNRSFPKALPLSIFVIEPILSLLFLCSLRAGTALFLQSRAARRQGERKKTLVIGAGYAGAILLKALRTTEYETVGLLDDSGALHGIRICGIPVLGGIDRLPEVARRLGVKEVLIAIPSATGSQMLRITGYCVRAGVKYRSVPSLSDLISGKESIAELREFNLDDLLGREPVRFESAGVRTRLEGRVVMVTGAAGSIGSELCKQIVQQRPLKIICVDQSETSLFYLQQKLLSETDRPVICAVTDIGDKRRMRNLLLLHQVQVVFHAAAYKHVPMVEANAYEGVRNNVFAMLDLFEVAEECGCRDFLLISSDKAVNPSSLMGCTKRLGEMVVASRQKRSMRCVSVRFGNVLGSQGSVIPLFRDQIRQGRAVTVTHPDVTRYLMTIPEAVSLTLQAFAIGEHGDILVLDMGEPIRILDLARTMIRIAGKSEREIPIVITGLRPGEKLHESLFYASESRFETEAKNVMRAQGRQMNWFHLQRGLRELEAAMRAHDDNQIRCVVKQLIPEYEWVPVGLGERELVTESRSFDGEMGSHTAVLPMRPRLVPELSSNGHYVPEQAANGDSGIRAVLGVLSFLPILIGTLGLRAEVPPQIIQEPQSDIIHFVFARSGRHRLEIDDAASFRAPIVSRDFTGRSIDLHINQEGLIPGLRYQVRFDRRAVSSLRLLDRRVVQPGLDCQVLDRTWRESGRFLVGVAHSQLKWDDQGHRWVPQLPAIPLGESLFTVELFLRPALSAARSCRDLEAMDEIALYYMAMLDKSQTLESFLKLPNLLPETRDRMRGADPTERTFAARFGPSTIGEGELYNAQWLHPAALLIRLISQLPEPQRTPGMRGFLAGFTPFLVREQLLRFLYEQPMPALGGVSSHGRKAYWELSMRGLKGQRPWDSALSDIDLWLLSSAAELLGAHANDPISVNVLPEDVVRLKKALEVGVGFFQSKRSLITNTKYFGGDSVESASYFNGDYDGLPEMRGTAEMGKEFPNPLSAQERVGASWDIGHMYRVAVFLRSLYENRKATALAFPQYRDLQLVTNQYVYRVFNGDYNRPLFHNNFDGSDGWFRVGYNGSDFGQPPSSYCDMRDVRRPCMTPGNIVGWAELGFANPDLSRLQEAMIHLAFDDSPEARAFVDRYYLWLGPYKVVQSDSGRICSGAFYSIAAENADRFSPD